MKACSVFLVIMGAFGCGRSVTKSEAPPWRLELEDLMQARHGGTSLSDGDLRRLSILLEFEANEPAQADLVDRERKTPEARRAVAWRAWAGRVEGWRDTAAAAALSEPQHRGCHALVALVEHSRPAYPSMAGARGPSPQCAPSVSVAPPLTLEAAGAYEVRDRWALAQFGRRPDGPGAMASATAWTTRWPRDPNGWYALGLATTDALGAHAEHWTHAVGLRHDHGPSREALAGLSLTAGNWREADTHLDAGAAGRNWPKSQSALRFRGWARAGAVGRLSRAQAPRPLIEAALRRQGASFETPERAAKRFTSTVVTLDETGQLRGVERRLERFGVQGWRRSRSAGQQRDVSPWIHVFPRDGELVVEYPLGATVRIAGLGGAPTPEVHEENGRRVLVYAPGDVNITPDERGQPPLEQFAPRVLVGPGDPPASVVSKGRWRMEVELGAGDDGGLSGRLTVRAHGAAAVALAREIKTRRIPILEGWLQGRLRRVWPGAQVTQARVRLHEDGAVEVRSALWTPTETFLAQATSVGQLFTDRSLFAWADGQPRRTPLILAPTEDTIVLRLEKSRRWQMRGTWATFDLNSSYGRIRQRLTHPSEGFEIERQITVGGTTVTPSGFEAFSAWAITAHRRLMRGARLAPTGDGG